MDWWMQRTRREQTMLVAGGAAVLLSVLYFGVVRPAQSFRSDAEAYYSSTLDVLTDVRATADQLKRRSQGRLVSPTQDDRPARVIASERARQLGLLLIRIQPQDNGAISFWFTDVNSRDLFSWMVSLSQEHGLTVDRADIQKSASVEAVSAQIVLRGP